MKRAYLIIRLAFEAIIGVFLLFKCISGLFISFYRNLTIATILGVILGSALIFDAFRVRRMLNQLDAVNDPTPD